MTVDATPVSRSLAAFAANIEAARNVVRGGRALEHLRVGLLNVGDLYRGAWFQAVSALDVWAHEEISQRIAVIAPGTADALPSRLRSLTITVEQAVNIQLGQLSVAEVVTEAVDQDLRRTTLQRPRALANAIKYVSDVDLWRQVAAWLRDNSVPGYERIDAGALAARLDEVVERRNQIAHGADTVDDGSGEKRPIDADSAEEAIRLIELVAHGVASVLGPLPEPDPAREIAQAKTRRPSSVALIAQARALPEGCEIRFSPGPNFASQFAVWLAENPDRARATWIADGSVKPLRWSVDGAAYSASALVAELFNQAGVDGFEAYNGPTWWEVDGRGTLAQIAEQIHAAH